ncbi:MAG TPA: 50S ribosomal protein L1 [Candidatus Latescibacteria bacterium]|nr:50S ribosomal protein L1 [Candidatus Latescibacterota bacterium]HOS64678.1 50S ribosomal protein L1 [Candidatus Latescibacterota bacterium]HOT36568.1 50S ribosomal protein L1 [Candidatus Latescibacterota bacterium]HPC44501.1 50S ribosomal protein L1 [Candidatus Latescibacterota bacterium]HPK73654.1 50S ribosomal protein L1 [Candidatus Latescibacterota bacterium]
MPKLAKKYQHDLEKVDRTKSYGLREAIEVIKQFEPRGFDQTVEGVMKLNVDPRKADQLVRGSVVLPSGTGKTVRVLVFARGEAATAAEQAGADFVGADDLVAKIQEGWTDFDVAIATPDLMGVVGRLGRVLGPRGLMPNPKTGTVTQDTAAAVQAAKGGKIDFRVDKAGNVQAPLGRLSFSVDALYANAQVFFEAVMRARPTAVKGQYVHSANLCASMTPSVPLDRNQFQSLVK